MSKAMMPPTSASRSRDPRADARFARGQAAAADQAFDEAIELYEQAIELAPDWTGAWVALGDARVMSRDVPGAIRAFHAAYALDPSDGHGVGMRLAMLDAALTPKAAAPAYVEALFDAYAPRFEAHLTQALAYRAPDTILQALDAAGYRRFAHGIDLGCGTGLGGMALRPVCDRLTGVDLSARMVEAARIKGIYDRLAVGEIAAFLAGEPANSADLASAADVFVYVGELAPILAETARVLRPAGVVAFTAQRWLEPPPDATYHVGADLRFAHAPAYIESALKNAGFTMVSCGETSTRREKGADVPGLMVVARRG